VVEEGIVLNDKGFTEALVDHLVVLVKGGRRTLKGLRAPIIEAESEELPFRTHLAASVDVDSELTVRTSRNQAVSS
jgi:hypothetical protein